MHSALTRLDHRPWPLPSGPWVARQTWHDVLLLHWPIAASAVRPFVHPDVEVDEFDGSSWVSLLPFRMTGVTARGIPPVPGLSAFPEMNLRFYVTHRGRPGIWFVSLDADNRLAVWTARRFFHLPYFQAEMFVRKTSDRFHYHSNRDGGGEAVEFVGNYWPHGVAFEPTPNTIDHFLAERYCLYTQNAKGTLLTLNIHHHPWPLQRADAEIDTNTVATAQGIGVGGMPTLLHYAKRLDVLFWPMRRA